MIPATPKTRRESCYWKLTHQESLWKTANITVVFTKIEPDIVISIRGTDGAEVTPATLIKEVTSEPVVDQEYTIDAKIWNMTIVANPKKKYFGPPETAFEFTFKVVGQKYPWYEEFFEYVKSSNDPEFIFYLWASVGTATILILGIISGYSCCICYEKRQKRLQLEESGQDLVKVGITPSSNTKGSKNYSSILDINQNQATQDNPAKEQELELESINESEQGYDSGGTGRNDYNSGRNDHHNPFGRSVGGS